MIELEPCPVCKGKAITWVTVDHVNGGKNIVGCDPKNDCTDHPKIVEGKYDMVSDYEYKWNEYVKHEKEKNEYYNFR